MFVSQFRLLEVDIRTVDVLLLGGSEWPWAGGAASLQVHTDSQFS